MDVTKQHRVYGRRHFTELTAGDLSIVFFEDSEKQEHVRIVMADGRAYTGMNLGDFCLLLKYARDEIAARHWGRKETLEETLNHVDRQSTCANG